MNYLYNGVELPALPEWDKETYPYALIDHYGWPGGRMRAHLVFYSQPAETGYNDDGDRADWVRIIGPRIEYDLFYPEDTIPYDYDWVANSGNPLNGSANRGAIWSNVDIYLDNGTLYIAASEPILVADYIDQASFLQGWLVGRRLAGMRK